MKQWQILRTVFQEVITDNFEFTDYVFYVVICSGL